ncbi:MAG TPA: hypothetical protein VFU09_05405 [Candidatus Udaeobacter sp.]|nr:hypothetical protein [Candidatus Udaeobacter sp.]
MNELRPEGTGPLGKSEAARESGVIDEDTQSDRRMSNQRESYNSPDARVLGNVSAQGQVA